jgi:hypothetical protein
VSPSVLLVTVTREDGSARDLAVAADIGCAGLLGPLRRAFGAGPDADPLNGESLHPESLHDRDGRPIRPEQTLADAGVLDGDRLHLGAVPGAVGPRRPAPLDQAEAARRRFGPAAP